MLHPRGNALITALVFFGIFATLTGALLETTNLEIKESERSVASDRGLAVAEAGIAYARWHLAHAPDDFTDGTGQPGPYRHTYRDPQIGAIGTFELTITPRNACTGVTRIQSKGWMNDAPTVARTIAITEGAPALTSYAFLSNANVWFGGNEELKGPTHSNGGIRMDAEQSGVATSARETYVCGTEHGCSPPQTKPGIWGTGTGSGKGLWDFPGTTIDFAAVAVNLLDLKTQAVAANRYFGASTAYGYHAVIRNTGMVDVYRVTGVAPAVWGYDARGGWVQTIEKITSEVLVTAVATAEQATCGVGNLLFFEDQLWVEGEARRPVTLVAARFPDTDSTNASIIINGHLTTPSSGQEGKTGSIGLIAQKDVLFPLEVQDTIEVHAALFAQKGHVFRNYYCSDERYNRYGYQCRSGYRNYLTRTSITFNGSLISNQLTAWTWVDGSGNVTNGFRSGESTHDTRLSFTPPPYFPRQGASKMLTWEEVPNAP